MKFKVAHNVFQNAVLKGGTGALLLDSADPEAIRKNPVLRCVKITAAKNGLTVESSVPTINSKHTIPSDKVEISEEGATCLDIQELLSELKSLMFPHNLVFETIDAEQVGKPEKLWVEAFNQKGRHAFGWTYDTVDADGFPNAKYSTGKASLKIKGANLRKGIQSVSFAINQDEYSEMFNNIAICNSPKGVFVAGTDNRRGALAKLIVADTQWKGTEKLLVEAKLLQTILSVIEDDEVVEFIEDDDKEHLTIATDSVMARVSMPPSNTRSKFPDVVNVLSLPLGVQVAIEDKKEFLQAMATATKRQNTAHFLVEPGKEEIQVKYSPTHKPAIIGCGKIANGLNADSITLSTHFLLDLAKRIEGDQMSLSFTPDEMRAIVRDADDPNLFYVMQRIKPMTV